jgi:hypothetical protein
LRVNLDPTISNLEVVALIDTGCAKSAMSLKTFNKLQQLNKLLRLENSRAKIETCDGTNHQISGIVNVDLAFVNRKLLLEKQQILVIQQLSDDFLLGSDILGSSFVSKIQSPNIHFTNGTTKFVEQMIIKQFPQVAFKAVKKLTINPENKIPVTFELTGYKPTCQPLEIVSHFPELVVTNVQQDNNRLIATFQNETNEPLQINPNELILTVSKTDFCENLPVDEYMCIEEKYRALDKFKQDGFYQPSVTSYIEGRNMITEADKIEIPGEINDEEFLKMFDLQHFNTVDRNKLKQILIETRQAFSMHKYDIGKTSMITMDIELIKEEEDKVQKYVPIPMHVIPKANEILKQMETYGIIRECHVPSPYCSNILVIPKKDPSQVRLLFDGRLLNYNTKRMPVAIITKAEILAHLINKNHLSSLDFADAFFHIPLTEKAQNLTAFWTPNHAKRCVLTEPRKD